MPGQKPVRCAAADPQLGRDLAHTLSLAVQAQRTGVIEDPLGRPRCVRKNTCALKSLGRDVGFLRR
jgi:hypothetical protein